MNLEVVKGMALIPCHCILCGGNPVDENTGEQQKAIFAPGVDVNWGDSVYICKECAEIIADLFGRVTVEGFDKMEAERDKWKDKFEAAQAALNKAQNLLARIRDGQSAVKEARGDKTKQKKAVKA